MNKESVSLEERDRILAERNHKEVKTMLANLLARPVDSSTPILMRMLEQKLDMLIKLTSKLDKETEAPVVQVQVDTKELAAAVTTALKSMEGLLEGLRPTPVEPPKDMEVHFTRDIHGMINSPVHIKHKA